MDKVANTVYNTLFRSNRIYVAYIIAGAIAGDYAVDYVFDNVWASANKGVESSPYLQYMLNERCIVGPLS